MSMKNIILLRHILRSYAYIIIHCLYQRKYTSWFGIDLIFLIFLESKNKKMRGCGGVTNVKSIDPQRAKDLESLASHLQYALKNNPGKMEGGQMLNYVR